MREETFNPFLSPVPTDPEPVEFHVRERHTVNERAWVQFLTLDSAYSHVLGVAGIPFFFLIVLAVVRFWQHGIPHVTNIFFMRDLWFVSVGTLALLLVGITAGMLVGFAVAKITYANHTFLSSRLLFGGSLVISMVTSTTLLLLAVYLLGVIESPRGVLNVGMLSCGISFMPALVVASRVRELLLSPTSPTNTITHYSQDT